uniref:Uncharacterized protein n=1 Tax=Naja naja TaxID=35670 RepID=A0A8C7E7M0_NAJNA
MGCIKGLLWPNFEGFLFLLSGLAGTSGAELNGILGESVTFQVKTSPPFEAISWNKIVNANSRNIALVRFEPCSIVFLHPEFQRRVNISRDCRELHLSHLKKEDAGRYTAGIVLQTSKSVDESFDLRLFSKYPSHKFLESLLCPGRCGKVGEISVGRWRAIRSGNQAISCTFFPLEGGLWESITAPFRLPSTWGTGWTGPGQKWVPMGMKREMRLESPENQFRILSVSLVGLAGPTNSLGKSQGVFGGEPGASSSCPQSMVWYKQGLEEGRE